MTDFDYISASTLLKDCKPLVTKAKDKTLSDKIADKTKEVTALVVELKKLEPSIDKLRKSPDDPEANLVVGRHECFVKGDWDKGLPMLAKSSDEILKSAVKLESEAVEPEQIAKAADAWWDMAEKENASVVKVALKIHALGLYEKALPDLTDATKTAAEKRIAQAEASGRQHKVTLTKDFFIGVFEVTQGQWDKVMKSNPSNFKDVGKSAPVENVSWNNCQAFMKELNGKKSSNLVFRLPTEAEWEYVCRGGQNSSGFEFGGSSTHEEVAWFKDNSGGKTNLDTMKY